MAGTLSLAQLKAYAMQAGFTSAQASIMAAIAMGESGGRATAYNGRAPDNSYGLWQINMIGNMGPQRRQQFGISNNQQLFDPLTNARAAYAVFRQQGFGAWSVYKHGTYRKWLSGANAATANINTGNYSPSGGFATLLPNLNWRDVANQFGIAAAFFGMDPSLRALAERAAKEGWDATRFQGALQDTPWYKRLSAAQRKWATLNATDPAEAKQQALTMVANVRTLGQRMGIPGSPNTWNRIAGLALQYGWDEAAMRRALAGGFVITRNMTGEAGAANQALTGLARSYAISWSPKSLTDAIRTMLSGGGSLEGYRNNLASMAKNLFPQLASAIDAGQSVAEYLAPYQEVAARELNVNPAAVDWYQPKWRRALGSPTTGVMPLADWQTLLRTDTTYGYDTTPQARQQAAQFATAIAEQFGGIG